MSKTTCIDTFVVKKRNLRNDYYSFTFGPFPKVSLCKPGQFLHIKLPNSNIFFRRAFSIASVSPELKQIEIIIRAVGRGTMQMANMRKGDKVNILGPLGNKFTAPKKTQTALIVAGGVGFPPLMFFVEQLIRHGFPARQIEFFYGGRSKIDILERAKLRKLGLMLHPVTEDGSLGKKGLVTEPLERMIRTADEKTSFRLFSCGPEPMLKAINELCLKHGVSGELSLEAPMPCGIGVCLGCVVPLTTGGHARVCVDGPIFSVGEVAL